MSSTSETISYSKLNDLSDKEFDHIWNNPGTVFEWSPTVQKRGKSAIRHNLYTKCKTPKEMRSLYEKNQQWKVSAKEEFKWDFKRGNVKVQGPKPSPSSFFVRQKSQVPAVRSDSLQVPIPEHSEQKQIDVEESSSQIAEAVNLDYVSPIKKKKQSVLQSQLTPLNKRPALFGTQVSIEKKVIYKENETSSSENSQTWKQLFNSPNPKADMNTASDSPTRPRRTRPPFTMSSSSPTPVVKATPLSYDLSWLKRKSNNGKLTNDKSISFSLKRPWYESFQDC
jgi:hypothetical protein